MSNDFERFYSLIRARVLVICASEQEKFKIRTVSTRVFGQQKWKLKSMFDRHQYWFIDPDLVANGDNESIGIKIDTEKITSDNVNSISLPSGRRMNVVASAFREYAERYQVTADIYGRRRLHSPDAGQGQLEHSSVSSSASFTSKSSSSFPTTATTNVNHRGGVMGEINDADLGMKVNTANLHDWLSNMDAIEQR